MESWIDQVSSRFPSIQFCAFVAQNRQKRIRQRTGYNKGQMRLYEIIIRIARELFV